ncbi:MAG: hypothetical protein IMZ62_10465 [Chloroflexi bacterium]|nr:hypothetical protein [Chloroflexota bacterium]MBE3117892.1 hypothetical protein [Candidatus Atribacteria bacterium]
MALTNVNIANMALGRIGHTPIVTLTDTTPSANALAAAQCTLHLEQTRDSLLRSHSWRFAITGSDLLRDAATTDGTSTGTNTSTTLNDTDQTWVVNVHAASYLWVTGGTGGGQIRPIASNTASELTVTGAFATTPDATSTYEIWANPPPYPWDYQYDLPSDCLRVLDIEPYNVPCEIEGTRLRSDDSLIFVDYIRQVTDPTEFDANFVEVLVVALACKLSMSLMQDKTMFKQLQEEKVLLLAQARRTNMVETSRIRKNADVTWNESRV